MSEESAAPVDPEGTQASAGGAASDPGAGEAGGGFPRRFSRYVLQGEVGRGGIGVVYRALDPALGRSVAIKMLSSGSLADEDMVRRFEVEARAVAALAHPGIVSLYEAGEAEGTRFLAMEFVEGTSLDRRARAGPLPPAEAVRIVRDVASALHYAHGRGIVHRDVKPSNLLLDEAGRVRVVDFGLAKRAGVERGLTLTGEVVGTPAYMAPEQVTGQVEKIGPTTDVYGLGAVLYELITGRAPFVGQSVMEVMLKVRDADPVPARRMNPRIHRDIEAICLKAMEKEPERRYGSAGALAEEITRFLEGEPVTARGLTPVIRLRRFVRRHRLNVTAGLSAAAAAALVLALSLARTREFWEVLREDPLRSRQGEWSVLAGSPEWTSEGLAMRTGRGVRIRLDDFPLRRGMAAEVTIQATDPQALGEVSLAVLPPGQDPFGGQLGYRLCLGTWGNSRAILQRGSRGEFLGEDARVRLTAGRDCRLRLEQLDEVVRGYVDGRMVLEHQEIFAWPEGSNGLRLYLAAAGGQATFRDLRVERRRGFRRNRAMEEADAYVFDGDSSSAREIYRLIERDGTRAAERDLAALKAILCRLPWWEGGVGSRASSVGPRPELPGELDGELQELVRRRSGSPISRAARLERARILAWGGERDQAEAGREIASLRTTAGPGDPVGYSVRRFYSQLAESLLAAGRNEDAIRHYRTAIGEAEGDPVMQTLLRKQLGRAQLYLGEPGKAEATLAEAARSSPDPGEASRIRVEQVEALLQAGRLDEARVLCEQARRDPLAEREGTIGQVRIYQARILQALGDRAEGLAREAERAGRRAEAVGRREETARMRAGALDLARKASGLKDARDRPKPENLRACLLRADLEARDDRVPDALRILQSVEQANTVGGETTLWIAMEAIATRIRILDLAARREEMVDAAQRLVRKVEEVPGTYRAGWYFKSLVPEALLGAAEHADDAPKAEILKVVADRFPYMRRVRDQARRSLDDLVWLLQEEGIRALGLSDRVEAEWSFRTALDALGPDPPGEEAPVRALVRGDLLALLGEEEKAARAYRRARIREGPFDGAALLLRLRRGEIDVEGLRKAWPADPGRRSEMAVGLGDSYLFQALALPDGAGTPRRELLEKAVSSFEEALPEEWQARRRELRRIDKAYAEAVARRDEKEQARLDEEKRAVEDREPGAGRGDGHALDRLALVDELLLPPSGGSAGAP